MKDWLKRARIFMRPQISTDEEKRLGHQMYREYLSWARYILYIAALVAALFGVSNLVMIPGWQTDRNEFLKDLLAVLDLSYAGFIFVFAFLMRRQRTDAEKTGKSGISDYLFFIITLAYTMAVTLLLLNAGVLDISIYLIGMLALCCMFRPSQFVMLVLLLISQAVFCTLLGLVIVPAEATVKPLFQTYVLHTTAFAFFVFLIRRVLSSIRINLLLKDIKLEDHARQLNERNEILEMQSTKLRTLNDELLHVSEVDFLTGLANRRKLDEMYGREWARAMRSREPLSLLIVDVDYFTRYTERYGQSKSEDLLKKIAQIIRKAARRRTDLPARYGRDEYVILLPDTDREGAMIVGESIIRHVKAMEIETDSNETGRIQTVSVGGAVLRPSRAIKQDTLFILADAALRKAKAAGRNALRIDTEE